MKIINTELVHFHAPVPMQGGAESGCSADVDALYLDSISETEGQTDETAISPSRTGGHFALARHAQARNAELLFRAAEAQNSAHFDSLNRAFAASVRITDHRCQRLDSRIADLARALDVHQETLSQGSERHSTQAATLEEAISMLSLRFEALEARVTGLEHRCAEQDMEQISQQKSADRSLTEWLTRISDQVDVQEERWQTRWSKLQDDVERRFVCAEAAASESHAALRRHREETNVWLDEMQLHIALQSRFGRE